MRSRQVFVLIGALLLLLGIIGGLYYVNSQIAAAEAVGRDFRLYWAGMRFFLFQGVNPYQAELAAQIRQQVYGVPLSLEGYPHRLEYPFYVLLAYLPFSLFSEANVSLTIWLLALQTSLVVTLFFGLHLLEWRPSFSLLFLLVVFVLFWHYNLIATLDGNSVVLLGLLFAGVLAALRQGADEAAGILLAFTTFKWEAGGLVVLLVLWWAFSARRWRVLSMFAVTLTILLVLVTVLVPSWFWPFQQSVFANLRAGKGFSTFQVFRLWWPGLGEKTAWGLTAVLCLLLLLEWRSARRADFRHLLWTVALTLAATPLLGLPIEPVNLALLTLPVLILLAMCRARWQKAAGWLVPLLLVLFIGLPWAAVLSADSLRQSVYRLAFALPAILILALYWLKWWVIRPPRVWLDQIKSLG